MTAADLIAYVRDSIQLLRQATGCGTDQLRVRVTQEALDLLMAEMRREASLAVEYPTQLGTLLGLPVFALPEGGPPAEVQVLEAGLPLDHGLSARPS